jgi:hypothetical protein
LDHFERQVILGVFTHRTTYLPALLASKCQQLPELPLLVQISPGTILENITRLWQAFQHTDYRYWVFLDDDIEFLSPHTVRDALHDLVNYGWGMAGVYSTFNPAWGRTDYDASQLPRREVPWVPGYFMLVDRTKMGDVAPEPVPDGNTGLDTTYCMQARLRGLRIGLSPNVVYHVQKAVQHDPVAGRKMNDYVYEKWGSFYFENTHYPGCVLEWGLQ